MVYVALAEAAVLVAVVFSFTGLLRWQFRAHARERDAMLNKLLHSVGRPWEPAPAGEAKVEQVASTWTWSPEQLPVYDEHEEIPV